MQSEGPTVVIKGPTVVIKGPTVVINRRSLWAEAARRRLDDRHASMRVDTAPRRGRGGRRARGGLARHERLARPVQPWAGQTRAARPCELGSGSMSKSLAILVLLHAPRRTDDAAVERPRAAAWSRFRGSAEIDPPHTNLCIRGKM